MIFCIIGYSRSGTTYLSNLIYNNIECVQLNEPHLLWKNVDRFNIYDDVKPVENERIRNYVLKKINHQGKIVIEKSPPNIFRPELVKYVLPEAKIIFIERDEDACLHSNLIRTNKSHGLNPKKYLYTSRPEKYELNKTQTVNNTLLLHEQIHLSQVFNFTHYSFKKYAHKKRGLYPFGPKLRDYEKIIEEKGPEYYHSKCIDLIKVNKQQYQDLFTDIFFTRLENVDNDIGDILSFIKECSQN